MKKHFAGATYDLTQENMNHLIAQLEETQARVKRLYDKLRTKDSELTAMRMGRAKAERVLAEIASFGNADIINSFDYQGDAFTARNYFDDVYGSDYCEMRDADVEINRAR